MPRRHLLLVAATALAVLGGCRRETILRGEVFVVTRSGTNVRLGLVQVSAIPERDAVTAVERFRATATREFEEQTRVALAAGAEAEKATAAWNDAKRASDAKMTVAFDVAASPNRFRALLAESEAASRRAEELRKVAEEAHRRLEEELEKAEGTRSAERLFSQLPQSALAVRTDADGRFVLRLPNRDRHVIAARGSREVGDAKEEYFWLVRTPANGPAVEKFLLSNHNQVNSGSEDSLVDLTTIGTVRDASRAATADADSRAGSEALRSPSPSPKE